jgi:DNA-directed RNA polymerase subunit RPC12/RpoP
MEDIYCERCNQSVKPIEKMAGGICPLCRIILKPRDYYAMKEKSTEKTSKDPDPIPTEEPSNILV